MRFRRLGKSDIEVSTIAMGCWAIAGGSNWGPQDETDSIDALRASFDSGITFYDTAEGYGAGRSEQLVGRALGDVRDEIVLATKVSPRHFDRAGVVAACEQSLVNLQTDRIDLYQLHWPSRDIPIEETLGALETLRSQGKIRACGVSNFGPLDLRDSLSITPAIAVDQVAYNLLFRAVEFEITPLCLRHDVSLLCYSPLLQGILAGKFSTADDVPVGRARTRHFSRDREEARHGTPGAEDDTFRAVAAIRNVAAELDMPMSELALAWLQEQPAVGAVLAGARNAEQARKNAAAGDVELSGDVIRRLNDITDALKTRLGPNADMWQDASRMR